MEILTDEEIEQLRLSITSEKWTAQAIKNLIVTLDHHKAQLNELMEAVKALHRHPNMEFKLDKFMPESRHGAGHVIIDKDLYDNLVTIVKEVKGETP